MIDLKNAKIEDIYPSSWGYILEETAKIEESDADYFRIKKFGDIYLYHSEDEDPYERDEEYLYDLYLSKKQLHYGSYRYFTFSDMKHFCHIDYREDLDNPRKNYDIDNISDAVYLTYKNNKELVGKEPMPFCGCYMIKGQVPDDYYNRGYGRTSIALYFSHIYVYKWSEK